MMPLSTWFLTFLASLLSGAVGHTRLDTLIYMFQTVSYFLINALWTLPLFIISRIVNALWFQDIANASGRRFFGVNVSQSGSTPSTSATAAHPYHPVSLSRNVADFILTILLETIFLVQSSLVVYVIPLPFIPQCFLFVHLCLLYSLYAFEYAWMSQGVELSRRLDQIETYWIYYLGFGSPLAIATLWHPSYIVSGCLFGALFPLFIISSFASRRLTLHDKIDAGKIGYFKLKLFLPSVFAANQLSLTFFRRRAFVKC